jgi:hypothetical protein
MQAKVEAQKAGSEIQGRIEPSIEAENQRLEASQAT